MKEVKYEGKDMDSYLGEKNYDGEKGRKIIELGK